MCQTTIKKVVRLSWVIQAARAEFEAMKECPELDADFFSEDELKHYVGILIKQHSEDWIVINDIEDERAE